MAECMESIVQCYSSKVKYGYVKDLVDDLRLLFKQSTADGGEASGFSGSNPVGDVFTPDSRIGLENVDLVDDFGKMVKKSKASDGSEVYGPSGIIPVGNPSPDGAIGIQSPKKHMPTKHVYSDLTFDNRIALDRARFSFKNCLQEQDAKMNTTDLTAILHKAIQDDYRKMPFNRDVENHLKYIDEKGYILGFIRLMRLIFDHLIHPHETIGIPNEYMQLFTKVSRRIPKDYKDYRELKVDDDEEYDGELTYIEYYAVVLTFMMTVQVDAPQTEMGK